MYKKVAVGLALAIGLQLIAARGAHAQIDVEMAFDPDVASVGDVVTLYASVANLGAKDELVALSLTVTAGVLTVGPIEASFSLGAGEESSAEIPFIAFFPGTLTLDLAASAGAYSDAASATLTVEGFGAPPSSSDLSEFADEVLDVLSNSPMSVDAESWGAIKSSYR